MTVLGAVGVTVLLLLPCGRRSAHEPEMTVRPGVGMAVQSPAVGVNVRVRGDHQVKLSQASWLKNQNEPLGIEHIRCHDATGRLSGRAIAC
jgi:hypothetical protein